MSLSDYSMQVVLVASSGPIDRILLDRGIQTLQTLGFSVEELLVSRKSPISYLSASDEERLLALQTALSQCKIVWAARGGYGLTRILPELASTQVNSTVVGFSDTSALLLHLWKHQQIHSIHASSVMRIADEPTETNLALLQILRGHAQDVKYPTLKAFNSLVTSQIEGTLIACNLSVLTALVGTSSMPDLSGSILILEEVGEASYRIDRMLTQLQNSSSLRGVSALVLGHMTDCSEDAINVFVERVTAFGIPLLGSLPVGHESPNWPIPVGVQARLELAEGHYQLRVLSEIYL